MYADYPVSHYTGIPEISIPLHEISIDDYILPISLSYHASGVKVNQEASWVGLGWALNAGGIISRTVKCVDDFLEYSTSNIIQGYYNGPEASDPTSNTFYTYTNDGGVTRRLLIADSEPDIFSYSFPGGSSKFLLDKSRGPVLFDKSANIKIEVLTNSLKKYFRLTAPDGTVYIFNSPEITRSYGREGYLNKNLSNSTKFDEDISNYSYQYYENSKYTSSWYLTKL